MVTEDYVSLEVAKLLKEKGFKGLGERFYEKGVLIAFNNYWWRITPKQRYEAIEAPTLQMAMKWLREVHKIIPIILTGEYSQKPLYYWFRIDVIIEGRLKYAVYREDEKEFYSYEEACEAAIKYCLENLIYE